MENIKVDKLFLVTGFQKYIEGAHLAKQKYDILIKQMMMKYELSYESECILGQVLHNRRVNGKRNWDLSQAINNQYSSLFQTFRSIFQNENEIYFFGKEGYQIDEFFDEGLINSVIKLDRTEENLKKASAWYFVCYSIDSKSPEPRLFSFCWVVADLLFTIQNKNIKSKR